MEKLNYSLRDFLEVRLRDSFLVIESSQDFLILKSKKHRDSQYTLSLNDLHEEHIYRISEILEEVYRNVEVPNSQNYMSVKVDKVPLNNPNPVSSKFVKMVLALDTSPMHKLFVLTSGNYWLSDHSADLVFAMAAQKEDFCDSPSRMFGMHRDSFEGMRKYYILPTVSVGVFMNDARPYWLQEGVRTSLDQTARLLAFIGHRKSTTTFAEYSKLSFSKAIETDRAIHSFSQLNDVQKILISKEYSQLAESMTAAELIALSKIIPNSGSELRLPTDFLKNRARAMIGQTTVEKYGYASVYWYLSDEEVDALDSNNGCAMIDKSLLGNIYSETPPFIYAAIAEVLVAKGEKKVFEILKELTHVPFADNTKPEVFVATTELILEALDLGNSDVPFGWAAQMSEHAWVLAGSKEQEELALKGWRKPYVLIDPKA